MGVWGRGIIGAVVRNLAPELQMSSINRNYEPLSCGKDDWQREITPQLRLF